MDKRRIAKVEWEGGVPRVILDDGSLLTGVVGIDLTDWVKAMGEPAVPLVLELRVEMS